MLKKLDLTSIAEGIVSPYRPIPVVSLATVEMSLFICQGSRSWRRQVPHDSLLFVLEGVITVDSPNGKMVVNEGELASAPRDVGHSTYSGMRSTVLLIEQRRGDGQSNGHRTPPTGGAGVVSKVNVAVDVRDTSPFDWLPAGTAGSYAAIGSRLRGMSASYLTPAGSLMVVVHRGVLDYDTPDERGALVGGQVLIASPETPVTFRSEHGATALVLAREDAPLPAAVGGTAPQDSEHGGGTAAE